MTTYQASMRGVPVTLLSGVSSTGASNPICPPVSNTKHKFTIQTSAGVSAGGVTFESASDPAYTGTWSPIAAEVTVSVASSELEYNYIGTFQAVRARVSTQISGGTISVQYSSAPN